MIMDIVWLVAGLVLILAGANALTDGASAIAKRMGISELVVGLTVGAFGTSTPELVISVVSAINGNSQLAIGNVVGSNIMNILVIIGVTAMVRPITVTRSVMSLEIPMVILSSAVLLVLGNSGSIDGGGVNEVSRVSGIFLLIFFLLFMRYTFASAKQPDLSPAAPAEARTESAPMPMWKSAIYVVLGLAALVCLTIVAVGTSLPELATSVVAATKGRAGLAVGNVIGSNIFNVLMVLGVSATIKPLPFDSIGNFDLLTLLTASILFYLFGWLFKERTITRIEGALLTSIYIAYVAILLIRL